MLGAVINTNKNSVVQFTNDSTASVTTTTATTAPSWINQADKPLKYENLAYLAEQNGIVSLDPEQKNKFFSIDHPEKVSLLKIENSFVGWKLHISVDPQHLQEAFDLIAPIISQHCFVFKVINLAEITSGDRLYHGAQITVYLEEQEKPVLTAEQADQMVREIDRVLSAQKIPAGKIPDSDMETISPYVSMRNDKYQTLLKRHRVEYCPAQFSGKNCNPLRYSNPFNNLSAIEAKPFDPLTHFQSLMEGVMDIGGNQAFLSYLTLASFIREHTLFEQLDRTSQENFILQYCVWNGEKFDGQILKEPYRNNPEVLLAVKQAFSIMLRYETDMRRDHLEYHQYIGSAQLSTQYPYSNSFKKFLLIIEEHSKQQLEDFPVMIVGQHSLINSVALHAEKMLEKCPEEQCIEFVQKGSFFNALGALHLFRKCYEPNEYHKLLFSNDSVPAARYEIERIFRDGEIYLSDDEIESRAKSLTEENIKQVMQEVQTADLLGVLSALPVLKHYYAAEPAKYRALLSEHRATVPAMEYGFKRLSENDGCIGMYLQDLVLSDVADYLILGMNNGRIGSFVYAPDLFSALVNHHNLQELQTLSERGNSPATAALAMIYGRDVLTEKTLPGIEKFEDVPVNHEQAKAYLDKLSSNAAYADVIADFRAALVKSDATDKNSSAW